MPIKYQRVSLRVQYHTQIGEDVFVAGPLWGWDNPKLMTWNIGAYWEFTFGVPVSVHPLVEAQQQQAQQPARPQATAPGAPSPDPLALDAELTSTPADDTAAAAAHCAGDLQAVPRAVLEYKYFVRARDGSRIWEPCNNRRIGILVDVSGGDRTWLVADVWMQPALTKAVWGRTAQERLAIAQQKREEDKRASEAGMRFFRENLERTKVESAERRHELEVELLESEKARQERLHLEGLDEPEHVQVAHRREEALKAIHTVVESPHLRPKPYNTPLSP